MPEFVPIEVFAEIFYKEAIKNKSIYDEYEQMIIDEGISRDKKHIEWEVFYLMIFILTYCLQRKFAHLGREKIKKLLDAIHKHIYSPAKHPNLSDEELKDIHNIITIRYSQYYKAIAIDWEAMEKATMDQEKKGMWLFSTLVIVFLKNLIDIRIEDLELKEYLKFTKFRMKFGLMIGYLCGDMLEWLEKIKGKYEIEFNS